MIYSIMLGFDYVTLDVMGFVYRPGISESSYLILMQALILIVLLSFGTMYAKTHLTKESSNWNVSVFHTSHWYPYALLLCAHAQYINLQLPYTA